MRRLETLSDQWQEFAEQPDARVLCWLVTPDEYAMVDAFLAMESEAETAASRDLFVRLTCPFVAGRYGEALLREFVEKAAALHQGLEDPMTPAWQAPAAAPGAPDPLPFLRACESFIAHYELPGLLALLLSPSEIADRAAFAQWLALIARTALPRMAKLRFILCDDARTPELAAVVQGQPGRVLAVRADLDMPAARLEVSEAAGYLDTPGGKYRHAFVQLTNALGKPDLAAAETHGTAALAITTAEKWWALAIPVHMALAGGLTAAKRNEDANRSYLQAESAAVEGQKAGDPLCAKLRVQVRLGRGSLLIQAGAWRLAATLYSESVPLAKALPDPAMVIDCHRLASLCHEQDKQYQPAWQQGVDGLGFARGVDKAALPQSTLAYLGESLARLCKRGEFKGLWPRIERELVSLLGPKWRPTAHLPAGRSA
jgi:hypothetical protein